jgi:uncharacterized membrane protein YfcA
VEYAIIFIIAIITSAASACVGLGGGLLLIPFLILIFNMPVKIVAGTMLFAMIPYTTVATIQNLKNGYVNFRIGLVMELGAVLGVLAGAYFSALFPNLLLKIIFILIVVYLMLTLRIPTNSPYNFIARGFNMMNFIPPYITCKTAKDSRCSIPSLITLGIIAGYFSGLLGIGGGFLNTPVLIVGVLLAPKVAVGTSLFMILLTSLFGTAEHAYLHHIDYITGSVIAVSMMIGAYLGTHLLKNLPEEKIKLYLFMALFVAAILTFIR